ncbi:MAG TPA: lytic transglycosylase domain-containing protein [Candidatus Binatia bacterium]|nr:lytic transglycosylase domain-containing protein [Candidatus Binatia bacterium]
MAITSPPRATKAPSRRGRARRTRFASVRPLFRFGRRAWWVLLALPLALRILVAAVVIVAVWSAVNWAYQVLRKPTELFFPVSGALSKTPPETWRQYGSLFRGHSTVVMTPELLAALAQVEGAGNPVARTYWRWRLTWNPFELYQPASSAVGMYQITTPTFREARRFCIHDHVVVEDGPWHEWRSCWFNGLYMRVVPSHAVEMTAALLDRSVTGTMARQRVAAATLQQKQDLAAIIHLCGAGPGDAYARRGFRLTAGQKCGDHDVRGYLAQVNALKRQFVRLAAAESPGG